MRPAPTAQQPAHRPSAQRFALMRAGWAWLAIAALFAAFQLPWVRAGAAALDMPLNDAAEWATLHPAGAAQTPAYLTALLVRLGWPVLAVLAAVWLRPRGAAVLVCGLAFVFALPPFEYLADRANGNYQQQAFVAGLTFAGAAAMFALARLRPVWAGVVCGVVCGVGAAAAIAGTAGVVGWLGGFISGAAAGPGVVLAVTVYSAAGLASALTVLQARRDTRNETGRSS
jgi:hypothetical protein